MFPYNDSRLITIKDIFIRQFLADIMFEIGAIKQEEDKGFEIDWDSINFTVYNSILNTALTCREKIIEFKGNNKEYCQAGRLFAYFLLGKDNKSSDDYINVSDLKTLYSSFLAFSHLKISYNVFGGVRLYNDCSI